MADRSDGALVLDEPLVRTQLLPYRLPSGKEVPGLVVEIENDLNGGVKVRVFTDANVVSGVTVAPLHHGDR